MLSDSCCCTGKSVNVNIMCFFIYRQFCLELNGLAVKLQKTKIVPNAA